MTDTRMITNLEGIEAYLREKLDAVSYIAVAERTGNREVQLVRLELPELSEWATPTNWSPMVEAQMGHQPRGGNELPGGGRSPLGLPGVRVRAEGRAADHPHLRCPR